MGSKDIRYRYITPNPHSEPLMHETKRDTQLSTRHLGPVTEYGQNLALLLFNLDLRYYRMSGSVVDDNDLWSNDGNDVSGQNCPK